MSPARSAESTEAKRIRAFDTLDRIDELMARILTVAHQQSPDRTEGTTHDR